MRAEILKRLESLEARLADVGKPKTLDTVFITVNENGLLSIDPPEKVAFETAFEAEEYIARNYTVTQKTAWFYEDFFTVPDGVYLPESPLWYFIRAADRKEIIGLAQSDPVKWLNAYSEIIFHALADSIAKPQMEMPGFDDPALKDLISEWGKISPDKLIARYRDHKWFFAGNKA